MNRRKTMTSLPSSREGMFMGSVAKKLERRKKDKEAV